MIQASSILLHDPGHIVRGPSMRLAVPIMPSQPPVAFRRRTWPLVSMAQAETPAPRSGEEKWGL